MHRDLHGSRFPRLFFTAALLAASSPGALLKEARAQTPSAAPSDAENRRTTLYQEGVDAAAAGRWGDARDRFAAALAIRRSPKVSFSLAQAEEHVGQLLRADAEYRRALETAKAAGENDVVTATQRRLDELGSRVPRVTVVVSGATGAHVTLDGLPVSIGSSVQVDPGVHRVVATAPGMQDAVATIALTERQALEVPLRLDPSQSSAVGAPPAPEQPAAAPERATGPWRVVALVTGGLGLVGAGIGGYFGLEAKSRFDESNRQGCSGNACTLGGTAIRRDALSSATASDIAFGVGGALIAAGVVLWFVAPSSQVQQAGVGIGPRGILVRATWW